MYTAWPIKHIHLLSGCDTNVPISLDILTVYTLNISFYVICIHRYIDMDYNKHLIFALKYRCKYNGNIYHQGRNNDNPASQVIITIWIIMTMVLPLAANEITASKQVERKPRNLMGS